MKEFLSDPNIDLDKGYQRVAESNLQANRKTYRVK